MWLLNLRFEKNRTPRGRLLNLAASVLRRETHLLQQ
jgi:hypothetical protein